MLFSSPVYSQASGSIAGITYSRNRGGMYTRARATPTDPSTAPQQAVRTLMGELSNDWINLLTQEQRDSWETYAANVTVVNALGASIMLSGQQHFIRSNLPRRQHGLAQVNAAPNIFDLGTMTLPTMPGVQIPDQIDIAFTNTDAWATTVGGALLLQAGRGQNVSINFFKGPWCECGEILGAVVPPVSPATINSSFLYAAGQRVWVRARASLADGRLTYPTILGPAVVTV